METIEWFRERSLLVNMWITSKHVALHFTQEWVKGPYLQGAVPSVYSKVAVSSLAEAARPQRPTSEFAVLQAKGATTAKPCSV